jgi:lipopolysaccharide transport system ATP-binding protein
MARKEIEEQMEEIVAFAELEEFIQAPIHTYSAGMRARLGFATAFQIDPDVLLIDEVLSVGDAPFVKKSSAVLHEKILSEKTVVLASHNVATLRTLCDRAIWIDKGRTRAEGAAVDVLAAYEKHLRFRSRRKAEVQ